MLRLHHSLFNHLVEVPDGNGWALYNFASGNLERLDIVQKTLFDVAPSLPADSPVVRRWQAAGFLCGMDEVAYGRKHIHEAILDIACGNGPKPLMLTVCPTAQCNFACPYCFQEPGSTHMTREIQDALVQFVENRLKTNIYHEMRVDWFGGEPLLVPGTIEYLSNKFLDLATRFDIPYKALVHTNGYLLTQKNADLLERCRVTKVIVTVDGDRAAHNSTRHLKGGGPTYDRIMSNLFALHTSMTIHVRCNLHANNVESLDNLRELVENIERRNGTRIRVVPAAVRSHPVPEARGDTTRKIDAGIYGQILKDFGEVERTHAFAPGGTVCPLVRLNELYITAQGEIFPSCHTIAGNPLYALGNVLNDNPIDWKTAAQKLFDDFAFPDEQPRCLACKLLPCCYGGCPEIRCRTGNPECPEILADPDAYVLSLLTT